MSKPLLPAVTAVLLAGLCVHRRVEAQHLPPYRSGSAWGVSEQARTSFVTPSEAAPDDGIARTRVEFVSEGRPQTVARYLGQVTRGTQRVTDTETVYQDLCVTPCVRHVVPGRYELYTHGSGIVSGVHAYRIGTRPVRFHLRVRPAWSGAVAGASLAVGVLTTLASIALLANGSINNTDLTPGWVTLGIGSAFGVFGTAFEFYAQGTGPSRAEPIP